MKPLADRIALVTGASRGIGHATALALAKAGAHVVAIARTVGGLEELDDAIKQAGGSATLVPLDLTDYAGIARLGTALAERYGRLDVLVGNAGMLGVLSPLNHVEPKVWEQVMAVNLTGMFYGCKRAVQQMIRQEPRNEVRGRLINLGSQQGIVTSPQDTPYGVSKAGAIYLTKQIAVDYAEHLIVCNCISPGKIVTGQAGAPSDPARLENARRRTPWPRLGRPQDIANAAVFLASDRATYMSGANLVVDGGWLAR